MNWGEVRSFFRGHYRDVAGTGRQNAELLEMGNAVYFDVADDIALIERESDITLTANNSSLTLAAAVKVRPTPAPLYMNRHLERKPYRHLRTPVLGTVPREYALLGRDLHFDIVASQDVAMRLVASERPAPLSADADELAFPEDFHRIVPYRMLARAFIADRNAREGLYWESEAMKIERRARSFVTAKHLTRRAREDIDGSGR